LSSESAKRNAVFGNDLELVLLPVDDDCRNLLIHENEDSRQQGREKGRKDGPWWIISKGINYPTPVVLPRWLKFFRYYSKIIGTK